MKRFFVFTLCFAITGFLWYCSDENGAPLENQTLSDVENGRVADEDGLLKKHATFHIVLENLTPATQPGASQPLSPPVFATHGKKFRIFKKGRLASEQLAQLAEDAVNGPLVEYLNGSDKVYAAGTGDAVILPGEYAEFTIESTKPYTRFSLVSMLVNTNDAFAAANRVALPGRGYKEYYLYAWDAGSEKNTESAAHIPGPCCGNPLVRVPTKQPVHLHQGIKGTGDLAPDVYGWDGPVAKLTIKRVH